MDYPMNIKERLMKHVKVNPETNCWEWQGYKYKGGYGLMRTGGAEAPRESSHRVSYKIYRGEIPNGLFVLHLCNNPACVNPEHLEIGDQRQNLAYMLKCGRKAWIGSRHPKAKLTEDDVRAIRHTHKSSGLSHPALAKMYNVSRPQITLILNRKVWRHVD